MPGVEHVAFADPGLRQPGGGKIAAAIARILGDVAGDIGKLERDPLVARPVKRRAIGRIDAHHHRHHTADRTRDMIAIAQQRILVGRSPSGRVEFETFDDVGDHAVRYAALGGNDAQRVERGVAGALARQRQPRHRRNMVDIVNYFARRLLSVRFAVRIVRRLACAAMILPVGKVVGATAPGIEQPGTLARDAVEQPAGERERLRPADDAGGRHRHDRVASGTGKRMLRHRPRPFHILALMANMVECLAHFRRAVILHAKPNRGGRMDGLALAAGAAAHELLLFAGVGFLIGGIDDLVVDLLWIVRRTWRRAVIGRRHPPATLLSLPRPVSPGRIAILVACWDEAAVIGAMLDHAARAFGPRDWTIFVGCYANDPASIAEVKRRADADPRIRLVIAAQSGPTTKADCLNGLWHALCDDERTNDRFKAVLLHDAEDVVHSGELAIADTLIERFDFIQLPVEPLPDPGSRWIAGHYVDEFAEAHGKSLVVRESVGAAVPAAGVGCAIRRSMLDAIAASRNGEPFDRDSLTEDYELGLAVARLGGRGIFVRLPSAPGKPVVAVRAHFPATLSAAVRQKARWMTGIALAGWDRLGWQGGLAERWMRLRDRRAPLAALVLSAAYLALLLYAVALIAGWLGGTTLPQTGPLLRLLLTVNAGLLAWRLVVRAGFVTATHGWREGMRSIPRALVGNIVAMMAARRALAGYLRFRRDGQHRWDKTDHQFPAIVPAE